MIDKEFEWVHVWRNILNINRGQVQFILNSKKVGRKRTIYAHACNKKHLSDSFREKICEIK